MKYSHFRISIRNVLHSLTAMADRYEEVSSGQADGFACDATLAAASLRAAVHFIGESPAWIPISEQEPASDSRVLVTRKMPDGAVYVDLIAWLPEPENGLPPRPTMLHVTHWMPLPSPGE